MSKLRIKDAPLLPNINGEEKIPTGGRGDYSVSVDQIKTYARGGLPQQIEDHINDTENPHQVSKSQVGLGEVDNTSDVDKPISTATQEALDLKLDKSEKGISGGLATLDNFGKVPRDELPSFVDLTSTVPTFNTPEAGVDPVTGVADGAYFNVRSTSDESYVDEYQNLGGVPTATGKSYPSSEVVQKIADYTALPFVISKTYRLSERVQLANGDIVKSTVDGNTNDPNVSMTGWVNDKYRSTADILSNNSRTQQDYNEDVYNVFNEFTLVELLDYQTNPATYDISLILNRLILKVLSSPTNPPSVSARGIGKIFFPKGVYCIKKSLNLNTLRSWGLIFEGVGQYATTLLFDNNTDSMFKFKNYNSVTFNEMAIIHKDVVNRQTNRLTWTNKCFDLDGTGGGRHFVLNNVTTHGFGTLISIQNNAAGNSDTNFWRGCTFLDCVTLLKADHNNAVVNHMQDCTIGTEVDKVFDVQGFGHFTVQNCNIVVSGVIWNIRGDTVLDSIQNSRYVMDNCKAELYAPFGGATDATTKLLVVNPNVDCTIDFRNMVLAGGKPVLSTVNQIDLQSVKAKITFTRSFIANSVKVHVGDSELNAFANKTYMKFTDCDSVPSPDNYVYSVISGVAQRLPIVYKNCTGVSDITLTKETVYSLDNQHTVSIGRSASPSMYLILGSTDRTIEYPLYNQKTLIKSIDILLSSATALLNSTVEVYSDIAMTALIATVDVPDGTNESGIVLSATIPPNTVLTEGIYFKLRNENSNGGAAGSILLNYINF